MLLFKIAIWKSAKLAVCCKYSIFCRRLTTRHPKATRLLLRPLLRPLLRWPGSSFHFQGTLRTLQEKPPPGFLGCREYYLWISVYVYMDFLLRHLGRHCKMSRRCPAGQQAQGTAVNKKKTLSQWRQYMISGKSNIDDSNFGDKSRTEMDGGYRNNIFIDVALQNFSNS